jgi:hypothetical protein
MSRSGPAALDRMGGGRGQESLVGAHESRMLLADSAAWAPEVWIGDNRGQTRWELSERAEDDMQRTGLTQGCQSWLAGW